MNRMELIFELAKPEEAAEIANVLNAAAERLSDKFGLGHWSRLVSEKGVLLGIGNTSRFLAAKQNGTIIGVLRLVQKKPWAIDPAYFTPCKRPLYLVDMAVIPELQGKGVGRRLLEEAQKAARDWPAQAIRLDAYDTEAGAGGFYLKCGWQERGRVVYRKAPLIYFEWML